MSFQEMPKGFVSQINSEQVAPVEYPQQTEYVIPDAMRARLENTFTYHTPKGDQQRRYVALREKAKELALMICAYVPPSREESEALTCLETAIMNANAGIARNE